MLPAAAPREPPSARQPPRAGSHTQPFPNPASAPRRARGRRFKSGVEKVQAGDVLAAAQRRLHPAAQTVVVVGDAASLRPQLEAMGMPVENLQLQ